MFLEGMGAIFESFNAKWMIFKCPTFACFALFFTYFSIFIREISKKGAGSNSQLVPYVLNFLHINPKLDNAFES